MRRKLTAGWVVLLFSVTVAATCADDQEVLFSDDFATLKPGWGPASDVKRVEGNRLLVSLSPDLSFHRVYEGGKFADVDLRLKVELIKGQADQPAGIVFWADEEGGCYAALVCPSGSYYVARKVRGQWIIPAPFEDREEIRQGVGVANELRVVTSGPRVTVYANGRQLVTLCGYPPAGGGRIGVHAESGTEPAQWAFSELTVRRGPAPTAPAPTDASTLYADDFETLDPAWGRTSDSLFASDRQLKLRLKPDDGKYALYRGQLFGDVDLRVKITAVKGELDEPVGVIFWASDADNCYAAHLTPSGSFYVSRRVRGKWISPVSSAVRAEVRTGLGATNELRIVTSGRQATIYANDQRLVEFRGYPPARGSLIGIRAESGASPGELAFADLRVRPGPKPAPAPEPSDKDASLLLADDFHSFDPAWGLATDAFHVSDHQLLYSVEPNRMSRHLHQATLFDDVDLSVRFAETQGWTDQFLGLVFWANNANDYCAFVVNPNGKECYAGRLVDQKWKGMNVFQTSRHTLHRQAGQWNQLRVVTHGPSAELYVNGRRIGTYKGEPPAGGSRIGLYAETNDDRAAWALAEFRVRTPLVRPEWSAGRSDDVLMTDDFRALPVEWPPDEFQTVEDHRLIVQPKAGGSRTSVYTSKLGDADIRINVAQQTGALDRLGGLIFWGKDPGNYYSVLIRGDGGLLLLRCQEGKYQPLEPLTKRNEVQTGLGAVNELRVVTRGKNAQIFANGRQVTTIDGVPPEGGSVVGIYAESGAGGRYTWAFSELVVRKPPASPAKSE